MTINARDVIAQPIIGWLRAPVARLVADHIVSALMEAAGVEPGGRLVIEHADGWPLGRLEHETSHFIVTVDTTAGDRIYRVVAP